MNYYLDVDNTLYETASLTTSMINAISQVVSESTGLDIKEIEEYVRNNFVSTTDNIFTHAEKVAKRYGIDAKNLKEAVKDVIDNGEEFVFEDAKRFLERLKTSGHKAFVLTYVSKGNQSYQLRKVMGSGLNDYFDGIILTAELKYTLDLDYSKGVFIDDDPRDLTGLYNAGARKVIRIKKPSNKRSKIEINNPHIEEYETFDDIEIPKIRKKEEEEGR